VKVDFTADIASERPGDGTEIFFHYPGRRITDGLLVAVRAAEGAPWFGVFARGETAFSGIFKSAAGFMLVVSAGAGYVVNPASPSKYWTLDTCFLEGAAMSPDERIAVCWTPWEVIAVDSRRDLWRSPFFSDGFKEVQVEQSLVRGQVYLPERGGFVDFALDLNDGSKISNESH